MFPTFSLKGKWEKKEWRRNNCKQRGWILNLRFIFLVVTPSYRPFDLGSVISHQHGLKDAVPFASCFCLFIFMLLNCIYCLVTWLFMSFIFTWQLDYLTCCVTLSRLFSYTLGSFQIRVEVWLVTKILGDGKDLSQQSIYLACHILT